MASCMLAYAVVSQGSGVIGDGTKYIIRTEVLYHVDKKERIDVGVPLKK